MISVDYTYSKLKAKKLKKYENKVNAIVDSFKKKESLGSEFGGWYDYPLNIDDKLIKQIEADAKKVKENSEVFVVCGIGGSYLGARAVIEAIKGFRKTDVEIIYLGNTFDERYIQDTLEYLEKKDFSINVISKSGTTLETSLAFRLLKDLLIKKYKKEYLKRIYITTDKEKGCLKEFANKNNLSTYIVPDDVGGRYSVFTPVGLLPIAVSGVNIKNLLKGAKEANKDFEKSNKMEENIAYQYAAYRYNQYKKGITNELFVTYSPYLKMVAEWWKQLFGESEGKDGKGLFPTSVNFSTDLHSLGQFVQQGKKCLFITQLKVNDSGKLKLKAEVDNGDNLNYLSNTTVSQINLKAQEGTNKAHFEGGVDNFTFNIDKIDEHSVGYLLYTFMLGCMISAYLIKVNPFNQPGVEFYKKEMKKLLKNS